MHACVRACAASATPKLATERPREIQPRLALGSPMGHQGSAKAPDDPNELPLPVRIIWVHLRSPDKALWHSSRTRGLGSLLDMPEQR